MDLAKRKEEWLRYYAQYFPTVEINSTFYRPPNEFMVNGWIKKAQSLKGFEYSVKMPQQVTHETLAQGKSELARIHARSFEDLCVRPLSEENMLGSVIVQLSPSYKMTDTSISDLRALLASLSTDKYRYAIEFRDTSWLNGKKDALDDAVSEMMWEKNVAMLWWTGPISHRSMLRPRTMPTYDSTEERPTSIQRKVSRRRVLLPGMIISMRKRS